MLFCPVSPLPNQRFNVTLNSQDVTIALRWRTTGLFCDLYWQTGEPIVLGVICQDRNRIVRSEYLGFSGDLLWVDTQGLNDPDWVGIAERFFMVYMTPEEIAAYVVG